jgi:hypothetical protein
MSSIEAAISRRAHLLTILWMVVRPSGALPEASYDYRLLTSNLFLG